MFWDRPNLREQQHREAVLRNLQRLQTVCTARGVDLAFQSDWKVERLEKLSWFYVDGLAQRARLTFADSEPCERRIEEIVRCSPAIPRPGQGHPWLQEIKDCPLFRR